jgi:hypothetical protein
VRIFVTVRNLPPTPGVIKLSLTLTLPARRDSIVACRKKGGDRRVRRLPIFHPWSFDDFHIIQDNLAGGNRTTRDRLVPYCLFTDPPLARVA